MKAKVSLAVMLLMVVVMVESAEWY
jgi:thioredoxin-related protein